MEHTLKVSEADRFPAQVTSLSHLSTTNKIINQKLTPTQLDMFRKRTIFGRFVDLDMMFCSALVHYFLLREVVDTRPDVMSFDILGTIVTFSKAEFLLMTGLWRSSGRVLQKVSKNRLRREYFKDVVDLRLEEFEQEYKKIVFANDDDAVKVSLIYYTEIVMMGKNKGKSNVDKDLYGQVEDLDYFNNMDWGTTIWQRTLKGLQSAMKDKVVNYKNKVTTNKKFQVRYSLTGFPVAFQVWAYEIIPSLMRNGVNRLSDTAMPRIFRYSCSQSITSKVLERDVFNSSELTITHPLVESEAERLYREAPFDGRAAMEENTTGGRISDHDDRQASPERLDHDGFDEDAEFDQPIGTHMDMDVDRPVEEDTLEMLPIASTSEQIKETINQVPRSVMAPTPSQPTTNNRNPLERVSPPITSSVVGNVERVVGDEEDAQSHLLNKRLQCIEKSLNSLTSEFRDMKSEFRDMKSELRDMKSELRDMKSELRDMKSDFKDVKSMLQFLCKGRNTDDDNSVDPHSDVGVHFAPTTDDTPNNDAVGDDHAGECATGDDTFDTRLIIDDTTDNDPMPSPLTTLSIVPYVDPIHLLCCRGKIPYIPFDPSPHTHLDHTTSNRITDPIKSSTSRKGVPDDTTCHPVIVPDHSTSLKQAEPPHTTPANLTESNHLSHVLITPPVVTSPPSINGRVQSSPSNKADPHDTTKDSIVETIESTPPNQTQRSTQSLTNPLVHTKSAPTKRSQPTNQTTQTHHTTTDDSKVETPKVDAFRKGSRKRKEKQPWTLTVSKDHKSQQVEVELDDEKKRHCKVRQLLYSTQSRLRMNEG